MGWAVVMKPYEDLPILPYLIADAVCRRPYTGTEFSDQLRSPLDVADVERRRREMTAEQIEDFANYCDRRCRDAYEAKAQWFHRLARSKTNCGRDQLYLWISHWLSAYLHGGQS